MRLEEIEDSLPDLEGQDGRVQCIERGPGSILGRGRGPDGLAGALALGAVPIAIAVLAIGEGGKISFGTADADSRRRINTVSTGRLAGATGSVDPGVDALDFTSAAARAGDA